MTCVTFVVPGDYPTDVRPRHPRTCPRDRRDEEVFEGKEEARGHANDATRGGARTNGEQQHVRCAVQSVRAERFYNH